MRLNFNASNEAEVYEYYSVRSLQLSVSGFEWDKNITPLVHINGTNYGYITFFTKDNRSYQSVYILEQHRSSGMMRYYLEFQNTYDVFVTSNSCELVNYFDKHAVPFVLACEHLEWPEYKYIESIYGNEKAKRSQVYLINHIDEGLLVLKGIGASIDAMKAYCLHPVIQEDSSLDKNFEDILSSNFSPKVLSLSFEYRNIANAYLSNRNISSIEEIKLSPLKDVNDMLIADKIQNYKDFVLYHKGSHPRSLELDEYFNNWFIKLNLTIDDVNHWITRLKQNQEEFI